MTSTSSVSRGRPCTSTACAPNRYQRTRRRRSTAASAAKRSALGGRRGTPEDLRQLLVSGNVRLSIGGCWPVRADDACVRAQGITNPQRLDGTHPAPPLGPELLLGLGQQL